MKAIIGLPRRAALLRLLPPRKGNGVTEVFWYHPGVFIMDAEGATDPLRNGSLKGRFIHVTANDNHLRTEWKAA